MNRKQELKIIRRAYAKQILAAARVADVRLEAAFADVPREDFLGPGPWSIAGWPEPYVATPSADPVYIYTDNVVGIAPERFLNNGQPSGHARWLASAKIKDGDHVVHVGTGTGYYTAIMAHLVGPAGRVTGIEFDSELATRAQSRMGLSSISNVQIIQGDGAEVLFDTADVIYVNAGVTRPADIWVDRLSEGGRLILPLTSNKGFMRNDPPEPIEKRGAVFRIERRTPDFLAQWISPIAIIPCESTRDAASEDALAAALKMGGWQNVTRLYRHNDVPDERSWLRGPGWCLAYC